MKKRKLKRYYNKPNGNTAAYQALHVTLLVHAIMVFIFLVGAQTEVDKEEGTMEQQERELFVKQYQEKYGTEMIAFGLLSTYLFVFICYVLNFKILNGKHESNTGKMGVCIVTTLAVTGIYHWVDNTIHVALFQVMDFTANVNALLAIWVLLSAQSIYHEHLHRLQHKAHVEAKLLTLQNQLNPHFLFNSLNTLNELIDINTDDAKKFLHNIANVLRYTLNNKQITTLQNELNVAKHYNQLLNTRFHHRLQVHYNVSEALLQTNIPTLTLLTLVENAIKHNAATDELPLHIHIETVNNNLVVSNNINQPKTITSSTRLGLQSLKERTKLQLNTNLSVANDNNLFKVTIPLNNKSTL